MKNSFLILLALALVACSGEQAETPAITEETPAVEEAPVEEAASEQVEEAAEEALQVVEESAAEDVVEEDDQPIVLAQQTEPAAAREWQFKEGTHFARMVPSQPTWGGADKIEVVEFFWYGCPHCYDFEPYLNRWKAQKDPNVRFVKIPAMWQPVLELHARLFYTEEVLARNGQIEDPASFRNMVFEEYHRRGNRLTSEKAIYQLFERVGISQEDFDKTWSSFEVDQNIRKAKDLARRYSIASVPAIVVNGKYRTGGSEAGSYTKLIEIIDELTAREAIR
ncbi:MAG: thiol:disulfide interchange protein DsbA/DsbL [Woeseiaceae bacterium]|nr:thiol:disulfide interchange protein DsbA/DsbL [Woeseiaceae bacterium]